MSTHEQWLNLPKDHRSSVTKPEVRCPIGLLLTFALRPAKPCRYFATFGLLFTSWPRNVFKSGVLVKNCQFPVNSGGFWTFSTSMRDLSSIDRIKTSYGAIVHVGDYPQLPELDNLSFFCPIGWFLVSLPHKSAQNEKVGRILAWWKIGLLLGYLPRPRIKFAAIWDSKFLATLHRRTESSYKVPHPGKEVLMVIATSMGQPNYCQMNQICKQY